ncbi:hypothetical protein RHMOL_Rhmol03G0249900 [Rhododendron molle]|uniref:Uncharacterized protein n=1 Tax=Rhododendron molle TaxID=49168 RepID=A0ACC0PJI9_RHOML|nr:hypothetical protein RHMOL_Rhmol03G0249900 [Rhododendron molle]
MTVMKELPVSLGFKGHPLPVCRSRRLRYCRVWSTAGSGEVLEVSSSTPSSGKVVSATQPVTNKSHWVVKLPNPDFLIPQKTHL